MPETSFKYVPANRLVSSGLAGCVRCGVLVFDTGAHENMVHGPGFVGEESGGERVVEC